MGWFAALIGRSPVVTAAQEASAGPSFAIDRDDIDPAIIGLPSWGYAGGVVPRISRREAMSVPAVSRSRNLIAGTIGQLPLDVIDTDKVRLVSDLLTQPERHCARSITITRTVEDLFFEAVAWWRVVERNWEGYPRFVERIDPWRVDVDEQHGIVRIDGKIVADADLIRFDSPNDPLLVAGARAIRTCLRLDEAAANYADGVPPGDYFTPAEGADPVEDEDVQDILNDWQTARRTRRTAYVPAALNYHTNQFSPEQLQLADARQHAVLEIARCAGVDPEELGVSTTSRTYANQFDRRKAFLDFTLGPYLTAIEERLSLGDVTKRTQMVRFNLDAFLRSDTESRYRAYQLGLQVGAVSKEEIRELEDRPALPSEAAVPAPAPTASQFSADASFTTFDAPAAAAEFKVDLEKRTIRGLAVPYGVEARSAGKRWQFSKGSLRYDDISRVKLLDSHDWSKPIGRAISLDETDAGLIATFRVVETPAGDEALLMASEQVKDGLSIGVAEGGTFDERDGVFHAVAAPLAHVALTPCPAFDSARVTAVAASKEGHTMKCTKCGAIHAAGVTACDPAVLAAFTASAEQTAPEFSAAQLEQLRNLLTPKKPEDGKPGPEVIPAAAVGLSVNEPLPYRFDGARGEHEFSSDLFSVVRDRDGEAQTRLTKFMTAAFDVTTTNVASVNPNKQRPDLFVDQLSYVTPVWDAINKGTLSDATPFVIPKWNSETTLVSDHTPGTEPSEGGYTTTSQTVTPGALSGKYDVYREVVDAGGNPQVSGLIWRGVLRAYYEALEAKAVALLDGLTPTAIALTTAAADDVLSSQIEAAFAALHFVRGGDRFDKLVLQEDLYKALVDARDADGRPLYPVLGAMNANGTVREDLGQIRVGGKNGVPAWALGASGTASESSYLFSSDDVHGWASAPRELRFEYQVATITFGVWGYQATANTRLAGVREITYDPVA